MSSVFRYTNLTNSVLGVGANSFPALGSLSFSRTQPLLDAYLGIFVNRFVNGTLTNSTANDIIYNQIDPTPIRLYSVTTAQFALVTAAGIPDDITIQYKVTDVIPAVIYQWSGAAFTTVTGSGIGTAINGVTVGLTTPAAVKVTTLIATGLVTEFGAAGIVAFAGGGQASATVLTAQTNRIDTVATRGDSVKLPTAISGLEITIINATNIGTQVFGSGTDTINGVATATGIYQAPNSVDTYWCATNGQWHAEVGFGYTGGLGTESAQDGITAFAGGGQTNAFQLSTQTVRIATVATSGDSVKLPASAPGLELTVINHGSNAVQVFGSGTDTINDVAAATGVSQMSNSTVIYICATSGSWYTEGLASGYGGMGLQTESFSTNLTANAGGGQTNATLTTSMLNRITTVATSGDSVKLPASVGGLYITIINSGVNPTQVFGSGTDTINGVAAATGVSQMQNSIVVYSCQTPGLWQAEGIGGGYAGSLPTVSAQNGITATAAGTQATALLIGSVINRITTVATSGDAVKLPASAPGLSITVTNAAAANAMNVFPSTGDAINALSVNIAYSLLAGKTATFTSAGVGNYHAVLSA